MIHPYNHTIIHPYNYKTILPYYQALERLPSALMLLEGHMGTEVTYVNIYACSGITY